MREIVKNYKVIGIVGSRRRNTTADFKSCLNAIMDMYEKGDKIVSGGCKQGADKFAEQIAVKLDLTIENRKLIIHKPEEVPKGSPYWKYVEVNYARNKLIAQDCDVLVALVSQDRKGGTENTIKHATQLGRDIILV